MLLGIQIFGLLFALFMIYFSFVKYKRKEFIGAEFAFWLILWCLFIALTLVPDILDPFLSPIGVARKMDFFIVAGFMFLIALSVYNYSVVRATKKKIEAIVRKVAFEQEKKQK